MRVLIFSLKERMTLKHSNKAKWARKQHAREHRDPAVSHFLLVGVACKLFTYISI